MRYFIEHAYNGTAYCGWQIQNNGLTVQQMLEEKLSVVLRTPIKLIGSSRTDTGVHAVQQYAHFDIDRLLEDSEGLVYRLNGMLPFDIAVRRLVPVADTAHSRFDATHRRYCYRIAREKSPFLQNQAYLFRKQIDRERMNEAAAMLIGTHDFESFSKIHTDVKNFFCDISFAYWEADEPDLWQFHIQSNRFLRGMVRALVGTLLEVGEGKRSLTDFERLIQLRDRKKAGPQAPPHGLYLMEVGYEPSLLGQ
jgi:tRNA pseudouridine38-40 synthase